MKIEKEKRPDYSIVEFKDKGRLILTNEVLAQIFFLHSNIGKTEWSGMLLYDVISGSPADVKNFVLKAKHIFLMDIGTAGATSYKTDGDIVDIFDKIPEAMEMKLGQIHTHHTMDTFFSSTDTDELKDNVDKHNYYLSLIVNMSGNYNAKVAFLMDRKTKSSITYTADSGEKISFDVDEEEHNMGVINMSIVMDYENEFFYQRLKDIRNKEIQREKREKENKKYPIYTGYQGQSFYEQGKFPKWVNDETPSRQSVSPSTMSDREVESLTSNMISITPELTETRPVYTILHTIADSGNSDDLAFYDQFLRLNIDEIMKAFFERELAHDELRIVIAEIIASVNRFSTHKRVKKIVKVIKDALVDYMSPEHREKSETVSDDQLNQELAEFNRT